MKKMIILSVITLGLSIHQATAQSENTVAATAQAAEAHFGYVEKIIEDGTKVSINYRFTPIVMGNELGISLHTPTPRPLSLVIRNEAGEQVLNWMPSEAKYYHTDQINTSDLPSGNYTIDINWDNEPVKSISITK